jgi:hypothetical protein
MIQPGPDEISQGMDRRRIAVPGVLTGFGDAWRRLRRFGTRRLIAVGGAAVLGIGSAVTAVVMSGPSYPHAWCGPVLTELHVRRGSDLGYAAGLVLLRHHDHAPVGRLLSDLKDYAVAHSVVQYRNDVTPSGSAAGMASTFAAVKFDLQALNRQCGQPPAAYESDSF